MALAAGNKLFHYEILAPLGAGAMGEVWRARDTRLGREVAIKALPEHFASDEERLRRFEREAQALASLNHPNVAQIFGVDQVGDTCFLVLELVPGESLEERLKRGPLDLDEALHVCKQMADGLEAAHEAGVIHRDLKPANVRLTPDGKVKVLDFGLAKPMRDARDVKSSTDSVLSTEAGRLLGTPTYMAPEQARGKPIDKRVDIWAFGCVLYECLTAQRAFEGETLTDVLAAVIDQEPDWTRLSPSTPSHVRELLKRCFAKDPSQRLRDIGEARLVLERGEALAGRASTGPARRAGIPPLLAASAVVLALLGTWFAVHASAPRPQSPPLRQLEIAGVGSSSLTTTAVSRDGRRLVYSTRAPTGGPGTPPSVRPLDRYDSRVIASTLPRGINPFFSPDDTHLGCFTDQGLVVVHLDSGTVRTLAGGPEVAQGSWSQDGGIVFSHARIGDGKWPGLARVAPEGGDVHTITTLQSGEVQHTWPEVLPDSRAVLFTVVNSQSTAIAVGSLDGGAHRILLQAAGRPRYSRTGHLLYGDSKGRLCAMRFDAQSATLQGEPMVLAESVFAMPDGGWAFDISDEGTLVYTDGHASDAVAREVVLMDRDGRPTPLIAEKDNWSEPCVSPDGQFVALRRSAVPDCSLWVFDRKRGLLSRIPVDGDVHGAAWSTDGKSLLFRLDHRGRPRICRFAADGSGSIEEVSRGEGDYYLASSVPDGSGYVCLERDEDGNVDLVLLDAASGETRPLLTTPARESGGFVSPDGRWLAYTSDESGRQEVYVRPFPDAGPRVQVSPAGGIRACWSRDGEELFYVADERLMRVDVSASAGLEVSAPEPVFPDSFAPIARLEYDVMPDGSFVMITGDATRKPSSLRVVLGWPRMLEGAGLR